MKPISASDILRQNSPRKTIRSSFFNTNRFGHLRDSSPADSISSVSTHRGRSVSNKRKSNDELPVSYSSVLSSKPFSLGNEINPGIDLDNLNTNISKVKSLCDKIAEDVSVSVWDNGLISVFSDICEALRFISKNQEDIAISLSRQPTALVQPQMHILGATSKKSRPDTALGKTKDFRIFTKDSRISTSQSQPTVTVSSNTQGSETTVDPVIKKFRESVKEAEKSSLVFNLNMGKVPIMNQATMCSKATSSLTSMAAEAEGKSSSIPSDDTVTAIDDVLSMVKSMSFFGKSTKTYRNQRDPKSGSFCTIPVRYDFKDKDTRVRAETILREKCKINCSTPYPTVLRESIRQVISHVKQNYPEDMVRVSVDVPKLGLKVFRKPKGESSWKTYNKLVPIPPEALDVSTRKIPEGFTVGCLPDSPEKSVPLEKPVPLAMEEGEGTGPLSPIGRISRKELFQGSAKKSPPASVAK